MNRTSKRLLLGLLGFIFCSPSTKADSDYWATKNNINFNNMTNTIEIYKYNSATDTSTFQTSIFLPTDSGGNYSVANKFDNGSFVDSKNNIFLKIGSNYKKYDSQNNTWSDSSYTDWTDNFDDSTKIEGNFVKGSSIVSITKEGIDIDGAAVVSKNIDGSVQIGSDTNDIDITAEGLNVDGNPLITKKDNGEIHIGKNSLITTSEEQTLSDGRKVQPLYAKDADGNKIPINIDGSKLLIDGVEVKAGAGGGSEQVTINKNNISTNTSNISTNTSNISTNTSNISTNTSNISTNTSNIKTLGEGVAGSTALTAALTALPQTSKESKLTCGVGTGAYSSKYAISFGCASKLNERIDVNGGGSYVFGGSKSYGAGTLDNGVVKAGFVFKLGKTSKKENQLDQKVSNLQTENKELKSLVAKQNERLEKLEEIALALKLRNDLEIISMTE